MERYETTENTEVFSVTHKRDVFLKSVTSKAGVFAFILFNSCRR